MSVFDGMTPTQKAVYLTLEAYGQLAVKDVVRRTGIPRNTVSKALNFLLRHGVLDRRAEGKLIKYWLLNKEERHEN